MQWQKNGAGREDVAELQKATDALVFSLIRPLADSFIELQCLCVCLSVCKEPTSRGHGDLWLKSVSLILACNNRCFFFGLKKTFSGFLEPGSLRAPTVDNGGLAGTAVSKVQDC